MVKFRHNSDVHNLPKSNHSSQNRPKPKSTKTTISKPIIILYLHVISRNPQKKNQQQQKQKQKQKQNKKQKTKNKTKPSLDLHQKKPHKFQQILSNPNIRERVFLMRQLTLSGIHKVDFFTKMPLYPFLLKMKMFKKHFHFLHSNPLF